MKPDIPPAVPTPAETQWVEAELISSLMRTARSTQFMGVLLIPVFAGVLWDDAPFVLLLAWSLGALAVAAVRSWIIRRYVREVMAREPAEHLAFFRRYWIVWPAGAVVWGLATLLYFDRAPLADQFICWLIMAGLAMFSVNRLSSHLGAPRWR
jgi:hypothetical protein